MSLGAFRLVDGYQGSMIGYLGVGGGSVMGSLVFNFNSGFNGIYSHNNLY